MVAVRERERERERGREERQCFASKLTPASYPPAPSHARTLTTSLRAYGPSAIVAEYRVPKVRNSECPSGLKTLIHLRVPCFCLDMVSGAHEASGE